ASLQEAVKKDPSNLELRYELRTRRETAVQQLLVAGDTARANGDGDSAITNYERVLALEPGNHRAVRGLEGVQADRRHGERISKATQLFAAKQIEAADLEVRAVLAEDPAYPPATALQAKILAGRGPRPAATARRTRGDA